MAEYKQVDLQIGTEAQFESKKETLPVGTFVGITDPIHKSELDSDLQTSINSIANKLNKPSGNPTENSVVTLTSTGTVGTKKLSEFATTTYMAVTIPWTNLAPSRGIQDKTRIVSTVGTVIWGIDPSVSVAKGISYLPFASTITLTSSIVNVT